MGFVKKFAEETQRDINNFEISRLASGCEGVKRTTGQHPGGIVIVPDDREIYEFCPIQHPANDSKSGIITTHFDYHKIDQNLLKLDILPVLCGVRRRRSTPRSEGRGASAVPESNGF